MSDIILYILYSKNHCSVMGVFPFFTGVPANRSAVIGIKYAKSLSLHPAEQPSQAASHDFGTGANHYFIHSTTITM